MPRITPSLWFDTEAEEAASFYASIFPRSEIGEISHYTDAGPGPAGTAVVVSFKLDGQPLIAINGGPLFSFTEAISLAIDCADQAEVDYYWEKLTDGGEEGQCGWLKDRYGLSWQVVPSEMGSIMGDPDPVRAERAMRAMLQMRKLDVAALRAAADGA